MKQQVTKQSDPPFQFGISSLLILTAIVAVHVAVPILLKALIATAFFVLLPGLLLLWLYPLSMPSTDHPELRTRRLLWLLLLLHLAFVALYWYESWQIR